LPRPWQTQVPGRPAVFGGVTLTSPPPSGADMARVLRRSQAVARLRHPNLVRMLPLPGGAGLSPVLGNARRLADFTLPAGTFKRFDLEQVVRLLLDVLSGLAALHEVVTDGQAFVHGHVSPQHIYIDEHGTARLVPLLSGAKIEDIGYTAPERLVAGAADARADVFSVGVMLWEALAGKRLFPQGLRSSQNIKPPPIRLSPDARWALPLCALAERSIALDPGVRFDSALALSNALAAAAAPQLSRVDTDAWQEEAPTPVFQPRLHLATLRASTPPPSVITIAPVPVPVPVSTAPSLAAPDSPAPASGRRGRAALVGVALLAIGAAGFVLSQSSGSWRRFTMTLPAAAAARIPMLATITPAAAPAPSVAPAPPVAASASAGTAGVVDAGGAAPPLAVASASARPPTLTPTPSLGSPKAASSASPPSSSPAKRKPARAHADDYGI
jgi:hypothetical protein